MLTTAENTRLGDLNGKLVAGQGLTDKEATELMALMNAQAAGMRAIKEAATKSGIALATDKQTGAIESLCNDFYWQFEGNLSWFAYRMEVIASNYNTLAATLHWPICNDISDLPALIAAIPAMYQGAVQSGRNKAATRYGSAWAKELGKLALLRTAGKAIGSKAGIKLG